MPRPATPPTIQDLLRHGKRPFSKKQQILVDFLFRNYQKVAFMNINELARATKVSQATIVRLAALLGFTGYPDFQKAVRQVVSRDLTTVERLQLSAGARELDNPLDSTLEADAANLLRIRQTVTPAHVEKAASAILRARSVTVIGFMASSPLALYFGYSLRRLLNSVTAITDDGIAARRVPFELGPRDLIVAFAFPRYPAMLVQILEKAGAASIPRLVFTDHAASPAAAHAEQAIYIPQEIVAFVDSLAAPMSLLAAIVADIVRRSPTRTRQNLDTFEEMAAAFSLFHKG